MRKKKSAAEDNFRLRLKGRVDSRDEARALISTLRFCRVDSPPIPTKVSSLSLPNFALP